MTRKKPTPLSQSKQTKKASKGLYTTSKTEPSGPLPSAFTLLAPSAQAVLRNAVAFFVISFIPALFFAVLGGTRWGLDLRQTDRMEWYQLYACGVIYSLIFLAAAPYLQLVSARGETNGLFTVLRRSSRSYLKILGLSVCVGLMISLGFLLFIVPGLILLQRYIMSVYFMIDGDVGIREAMRRSAAASQGRAMAIFGVFGVILLFALVAVVPVIGPVLSFFLGFLYVNALAIRYLQLKPVPAR